MSTETYTLRFHPQQGWIKTKIVHATKVELPSKDELKQIKLERQKRRTKSFVKYKRNFWNNNSEKYSQTVPVNTLKIHRGHA